MTQSKSAADRARLLQGVPHRVQAVGGQQRVGVQEEQDVAVGVSDTVIHLLRPASGSPVKFRRVVPGDVGRAVGAAGVYDDNLVTVSQGEGVEGSGQAGLFVEGRNDDGNARGSWGTVGVVRIGHASKFLRIARCRIALR